MGVDHPLHHWREMREGRGFHVGVLACLVQIADLDDLLKIGVTLKLGHL